MMGILFWVSVAAIVYVYAGYPALIAALSRLRPPRRPPTDHTPDLTVIISAHNEEAVLDWKIAETLSLDYPIDRVQIIVSDDGSTDATPEIARRYAGAGVVLVRAEQRGGKMSALNRAVPYATGEVILFSDANNHLDRAALREMVAPYADPRVGATTGRKVVPAEDGVSFSEGLYWRYEAAIRRWEDRLGTCTGVNGDIISIRRTLFTAAPPGTINDDAWMAHRVLRLGYRIAYCPGAVSTESAAASAEAEVVRRTRMVAGQYQALFRARTELPWRHPLVLWQLVSHKLMRPLVPFWMILALGATVGALAQPGSGSGLGAVVTLAAPWNLVAAGVQAIGYTLALAAPRLEGALGTAAYVPRFLVDSNLAALKGFVRYVRGRQSTLWEKAARRDERPGATT